MRFPVVVSTLFIGLAACAHPGGRMHAGFFHKREDNPAASGTGSPPVAAEIASVTMSKTSTSSSVLSSMSSATGSAMSSATISATSSSDPSTPSDFVEIQNPCTDSGCKWAGVDQISANRKCTELHPFGWNTTYFYKDPGDPINYYYGPLAFVETWHESCEDIFSSSGTPLVDGTWSTDEPMSDKYMTLVAAENCGLQIIALKERLGIDVTYSDLYAAARDAVAVMAATKGRFGIGGHLRCGDADDFTHAWRLVPRNPDGKTIVKQYSSFPKPWEIVKAS